MRNMISSTGLLAWAAHATCALATALPQSEKLNSREQAYVVDVHRDWNTIKTSLQSEKQSSSKNVRDTGVSGADWNYYWFMNITAGGQPVSVLMDTGSSDLWLRPPNSGPDSLDGVQTWNPDTPQSWKLDGFHFDLSYGTGGNGVNGDVYVTDICVGNLCTGLEIGCASHCQGLGDSHSGIMGFAFSGGNSIRPTREPVFMEAVSSKLDQPIFVTKFAAEGGSSQIAFGSNPFNFVPPLQNLTAQSSSSDRYPYSWSYSGIEYYKEGQHLGTFDVVFDTGGPCTSAHIDIVRRYYNGIPGARDVNGDGSYWTVPCGTHLPDLTMHLGDALLIIPGWRFYNGNTQTDGDCMVWFVKENSDSRGVIGNPFFAEHVVVFNQAESTIHWGNQA
ncbi:hypothetical protein NLG97_g2296 [Lecanicillium saksenae]|uniref:Uncharacterized protein n=1 Tax=Lecanicillium saksenae TaxID=468837 RepID=A0ACC1R1Y9_9HYPO|nr:hypothetical protein NLG97_g2296 [Lecanicillium saksenae]